MKLNTISSSSAVVTTYNGEKYILDQINSLLEQSHPFDEVIILDDCSKDNTVKIIEDFINLHNLNSWKLIKNEKNLGWKKNFKHGFDLAKGDYIFPCDQDDIWHKDKVEKMIKVMDESIDINLLTSNFAIFFSENDNGSTSYKKTTKEIVNDGKIEFFHLNPKWPYIKRPGCTFCFRKTFYDKIKSAWDTKYPHDAILWRYAYMTNSLAIIREPLINFRRHGDNATSVKVRTKEERVQTFEDYLYFHKIALNCVESDKNKKIIEKGIKFLEKRKKMYIDRNPLHIFSLIFGYYRYYLNFHGILGDLFFLIRNKQVR